MNNETVIGLSGNLKAIVIIIPPLSGGVIGWFFPGIVEWILFFQPLPLGFIMNFLSALDSNLVSGVTSGIGVIAGIFITQYILTETLKMSIKDYSVSFQFRNEEEVISKEDISAIFMDDTEIVVLGQKGEERFREHTGSSKTAVREAFQMHSHPWKEEDPYENEYQRWVTAHPGFSENVNALLAAREEALVEDDLEEAHVFRKDLAKYGVVVRDDEHRQYVRFVDNENG